MSVKLIKLEEEPATSPYKLNVVLEFVDKDNEKRRRKIRFGARGYKDYTIYFKDDPTNAALKKSHYEARHKVNEDWTASGIFSKGFWSYWILWNLPTVEASKEYVKRKFHV